MEDTMIPSEPLEPGVSEEEPAEDFSETPSPHKLFKVQAVSALSTWRFSKKVEKDVISSLVKQLCNIKEMGTKKRIIASTIGRKLREMDIETFKMELGVSSEPIWYESYIYDIADAYHEDFGGKRQVVSKTWTCLSCAEVQLVEVWAPDCKPRKCCKTPSFTHKAFIQRIAKPAREIEYDMLSMKDKLLRVEILLRQQRYNFSSDEFKVIVKSGLLTRDHLRGLTKCLPTIGKVEFLVRQRNLKKMLKKLFYKNCDIAQLIISFFLPLNAIYHKKKHSLLCLLLGYDFFNPQNM